MGKRKGAIIPGPGTRKGGLKVALGLLPPPAGLQQRETHKLQCQPSPPTEGGPRLGWSLPAFKVKMRFFRLIRDMGGKRERGGNFPP